MTRNVGGADRVIRIVVGAALILWFFLDSGGGFWHWIKLIGILPLASGLMGSCMLYNLLGINTCPMRK